jgi:hypothetical protein
MAGLFHAGGTEVRKRVLTCINAIRTEVWRNNVGTLSRYGEGVGRLADSMRTPTRIRILKVAGGLLVS